MADQPRFHPTNPPDLKAMYVDNGDGTYSLKVSAAVAASDLHTSAKGSTTAGYPTSSNVDANTQALDVYVRGGGGGGTQYVEDAVSSGGETGTVALGVRRDADTSPVSADGDFHTPIYDALGNLKVNVKAGSSGGPSIVDNAAFTDGTTTISPSGYIFDEVAGTALTENDAAAARIDAKRAIVGTIEDATTRGQRAAVSAAGAVKVDASSVAVPVTDNSGSLTVDQATGTNLHTVVDSGTITTVTGVTNVVHVDDNAGSLTVDNAGTFAAQDSQVVVDNAAFTDGTTKLFMSGYILDDTAGTALTENDAAAPRISTNRATVAAIEDGATRARYATVTASNALKVDPSAVTSPVSLAANQSVNVAQLAGTATSVNSGVKDAGTLRVTLATDQVQLTNALKTTQTPATTGGLSIFHLVSAATTNATNLKASAGQVFGWYIYNSNAAARKVAFHNNAGTPTAGASILFAIVIPPTSAANVEFVNGIAFGTGIAITTVTDLTDAGATAVAVNDLIINIFYS